MSIAHPAPSVAPDPEAAAFREAAAEDRLLLPRCGHCSRLHWYPRGTCPFCLSDDIRWEEGSGLGRVYSATVFRKGAEDIVIAYVELDEGLRLLTNILVDDPSSVGIGRRVAVTFVSASDEPERKHPFFHLIAED